MPIAIKGTELSSVDFMKIHVLAIFKETKDE